MDETGKAILSSNHFLFGDFKNSHQVLGLEKAYFSKDV